jgi:hypothetical protein
LQQVRETHDSADGESRQRLGRIDHVGQGWRTVAMAATAGLAPKDMCS